MFLFRNIHQTFLAQFKFLVQSAIVLPRLVKMNTVWMGQQKLVFPNFFQFFFTVGQTPVTFPKRAIHILCKHIFRPFWPPITMADLGDFCPKSIWDESQFWDQRVQSQKKIQAQTPSPLSQRLHLGIFCSKSIWDESQFLAK